MSKLAEIAKTLQEAAVTMTLPPNVRWVDSQAAAAMLGISRRSFVERVASRSDFPRPARPMGGMPVWKVSEVSAWMEKQRDAA